MRKLPCPQQDFTWSSLTWTNLNLFHSLKTTSKRSAHASWNLQQNENKDQVTDIQTRALLTSSLCGLLKVKVAAFTQTKIWINVFILHKLTDFFSVWQLPFSAFPNGKSVWAHNFLTILQFIEKSNTEFQYILLWNWLTIMLYIHKGWDHSSIFISYIHQPLSEPVGLACSSCKIYGKLLYGVTK